ncbi:MAG: hypothetical protein LBK60_08585 [Verrucomicrobiales bacterium]|jgi:hypothetical protein|nr:hypothetical protein [Verrucomicrobiales bacterium]
MNLKRLTSTYTLACSIFLHLAIFLLIGGVVIIESVVPKQPFAAAEPAASAADFPPPPELPPDHEPPAPADPAADPAPTAAIDHPYNLAPIAANITATVTAPAFNLAPQLGAAAGSGGSGAATTNPAPAGGAVTAGLRRVTMFSSTFEVRKIGVIMDVSGSAAIYILPMLLEIQKNFANDAHIILYQGCGLDRATAKGATLGKLRAEKTTGQYQAMLGRVLARTAPGNAGLKTFLHNFCRRDNVWCLYTKGTTATQLAFAQLIKDNVDTIYWFADFADPLDPAAVQALTATLKEKNIKIICHNFSGLRFADDKINRRAQLQAMAEATGGQTVRVKPTPLP